jgi:hypothetical protein
MTKIQQLMLVAEAFVIPPKEEPKNSSMDAIDVRKTKSPKIRFILPNGDLWAFGLCPFNSLY